MAHKKFGELIVCSECGAKFFAMRKKNTDCPRCGHSTDKKNVPPGKNKRVKSSKSKDETEIIKDEDLKDEDLKDIDDLDSDLEIDLDDDFSSGGTEQEDDDDV